MLPTSQGRIKRHVHSTSERGGTRRQSGKQGQPSRPTVRMQGSRARAVGRLVSRGCLGSSVAHVVDGNAFARLALRALHRIRHAMPAHICSKPAPSAHICSKPAPSHHEHVSSQNREGWGYARRRRRRKRRGLEGGWRWGGRGAVRRATKLEAPSGARRSRRAKAPALVVCSVVECT